MESQVPIHSWCALTLLLTPTFLNVIPIQLVVSASTEVPYFCFPRTAMVSTKIRISTGLIYFVRSYDIHRLIIGLVFYCRIDKVAIKVMVSDGVILDIILSLRVRRQHEDVDGVV